VDIVDDLVVERDPSDYISAFSISGASNRYKIIQYGQNGVLFKNKAKTFHESMMIYDKSIEMQRNTHLLQWIDPEVFRNMLRVEQRVSRFRPLREKFRLPDGKPMFKDILNSTFLHNFEMYKKLRMTPPDLDELYPSSMKLNQIEKIEGRKRLIAMLDYDMDKIRIFLQTHVKGNISAYMQRYRALRASMLSEKTGIEPEHLIAEIGELLKVA
jgi:hypothetical protein